MKRFIILAASIGTLAIPAAASARDVHPATAQTTFKATATSAVCVQLKVDFGRQYRALEHASGYYVLARDWLFISDDFNRLGMRDDAALAASISRVFRSTVGIAPPKSETRFLSRAINRIQDDGIRRCGDLL